MLTDRKIEEVRAHLEALPRGAEVFIGCDSSRFKDKQGFWHASYTTVIVVANRDPATGRRAGCRVWTTTERMQDYDQKKNRPMMRMMNEAYKTVEAWQQVADLLERHDVEFHLDINKDPRFGSNCAHSAAVGYVKGVTGGVVRTKPDAWAATHVADHGVRGGFDRSSTVH